MPGALETEASAPVSESDWLDRICPYLLSEDGTYRSTEPDPDHRCMAQDPPGTLPIAFQERFCLTERHVRCEMFKYARSAREAALGGQDGSPAAQVSSARFRPSVRSVPLALGPSRGATSDAGRRRPTTGVIVAAAGAGALIVLVLLALALNGLGGGGGTSESPTPAAPVSAAPTARVTAPPTSEPTTMTSSAPGTSDGPASVAPVGAPVLIEYEVQEGEALQKIAQTFGTTRGAILDTNEGMRDREPGEPYVQPGDIIIVPVSEAMSPEDIEAQPGFRDYVE
jgi:LysM repeat protein